MSGETTSKCPNPSPSPVDLELVRGDIPVTDPESELVGVSLELAYVVLVDAAMVAQGVPVVTDLAGEQKRLCV